MANKEIDWKIRWLVIVVGIVIMMLGQGSLIQIIVGATIALTGIYYGTKDVFLAYIKKRINRFLEYIKSFLPPF